MRTILLFMLCLILIASPVLAQNGLIGLFEDVSGAGVCIFDLVAENLLPVYVLHAFVVGATASQFKVTVDPCFTGIWIEETYNFTLSQGTFQGGIFIDYQSCLSGFINLGFMNFFVIGTSGECCFMHVVPDPAAVPPGNIWTTDCSQPEGQLIAVTGGKLIINPTESCGCTWPVEQSSWGNIKALYQN